MIPITNSKIGKQIVDIMADGIIARCNGQLPDTFKEFEQSQILQDARKEDLRGGVALLANPLITQRYAQVLFGALGIGDEKIGTLLSFSRPPGTEVEADLDNRFNQMLEQDTDLATKLGFMDKLFTPGNVNPDEIEAILDTLFKVDNLGETQRCEVLERRRDFEIVVQAFSSNAKCQRELVFRAAQEKLKLLIK